MEVRAKNPVRHANLQAAAALSKRAIPKVFTPNKETGVQQQLFSFTPEQEAAVHVSTFHTHFLF